MSEGNPRSSPGTAVMLVMAAFAAACLAAGCAHGPSFRRVESFPFDRALVYFYRPGNLTASGQNYSIKHIETELGKLQNGTYFTYLSQPGPQTFYYEGQYGFAKVSVDLFSGETYYIRGKPSGFMGATFKLELVHPAIARVEISDCRLSR